MVKIQSVDGLYQKLSDHPQTSIGWGPRPVPEWTKLNCVEHEQNAGNLASKAMVWYCRVLKSNPKAKSVKRPDLRNLLWNISLTNLREFVLRNRPFLTQKNKVKSKLTDLLGILNLPCKQLHPNTGATLRERNCYQYVEFILTNNAPTGTFLC